MYDFVNFSVIVFLIDGISKSVNVWDTVGLLETQLQ